LTRRIPNLDIVEVNNSFGNLSCNPQGKGYLTVVVFNAERGRHWLYIAKILKKLDADIIILNEMDIGMARSGQQHTTKLFAVFLKMNYAWALEFVELTRGTKLEQKSTEGMSNSLGLHGNAVLAKCPMHDPVVFRDAVGPYFSDRPSGINANGYEKRLGGRMAVMVTLEMGGGRSIVVGSTHKLMGAASNVTQRIGNQPSVIGGDQNWEFCESVGLAHIDRKALGTWPASCSTTGRVRGDIICSNMPAIGRDHALRPCIETTSGQDVVLSDHAIISASISIHARILGHLA
jgi:hypothetical protein